LKNVALEELLVFVLIVSGGKGSNCTTACAGRADHEKKRTDK